MSWLAAGASAGTASRTDTKRLQDFMRSSWTTCGGGDIAAPAGSIHILLPRREVGAAVLLPTALRLLRTLRPLLAIADGADPVDRYAKLLQELLGGARP